MLKELTIKRERVVRVFGERLGRLRVGRHPALFFNPFVEGYRDFVFGGKVGPCIKTDALFHELGHAAEFGGEAFGERGLYGEFAFKIPRVFVYDRYCEDAQTHQATMRELRAFAYQWHLMDEVGLGKSRELFAKRSTTCMRFMHDEWRVPGGTQEGRHEWCAGQVREWIERLNRGEVRDRLESWLDATKEHLERGGAEYEGTCKRYKPRRYRVA